MFKDVSNILQNFKLIGPSVFEIAGGDRPTPPPPVSGVGTKVWYRKG